MANDAYDNLRSEVPIGGVDWLTDSIKATLVDDSYTFDATHTDLADLGSSVVGGITDQDLNVTNVDALGFVEADSITFSGATPATIVQAVVVYVDRGGGTTELLWFFDTGTGFPLTSTGADITVDWNGSAGNGIVWKAG